jgi:hypothetical protein
MAKARMAAGFKADSFQIDGGFDRNPAGMSAAPGARRITSS